VVDTLWFVCVCVRCRHLLIVAHDIVDTWFSVLTMSAFYCNTVNTVMMLKASDIL